jgi:hypothetical protein
MRWSMLRMKWAERLLHFLRLPLGGMVLTEGYARHFTVSSRSLLALPDPQGPPPEHAVGAAVVALYPETTCLYRAQVIKHWKDVPSANGVSEDEARIF